MSAYRCHLKQPEGWFAAGREVERALTLLSDSAFKLFLWLCLHASRNRGSICANPAEIARSLDKPEAEMIAGLQELVSKGVCRPIHGALIEIADRFWPYQHSLQARPAEDVSEYVSHVKRLFLERHCVQSVFTAADDQLATELYRKGIPLEKVERAILLGCLRKYANWCNRGGGTPITTLHYFTRLFDEVERVNVSAEYWTYVGQKVRSLEQRLVGHDRTARTETK